MLTEFIAHIGRSHKHIRAVPIEPIHPRRRHISARMEVPDLAEIKEAIAVQEDECLRHYLYEVSLSPMILKLHLMPFCNL